MEEEERRGDEATKFTRPLFKNGSLMRLWHGDLSKADFQDIGDSFFLFVLQGVTLKRRRSMRKLKIQPVNLRASILKEVLQLFDLFL